MRHWQAISAGARAIPYCCGGKKACGNAPPDVVGAARLWCPQAAMPRKPGFWRKTSLEDLAALRAAHPSAHL